jgi:hypothetical protein
MGALLTIKDNSAEFDRLLNCLAAGNQEWAQNAPVLMLSVAELSFSRDGSDNRHAFHDIDLNMRNLGFSQDVDYFRVRSRLRLLNSSCNRSSRWGNWP